MIDARDCDLTGFQRLAQRVEHLTGESGHLVEEENAIMGSDISPGRERRPPPTKAGIEAE